MLERLAMGLFGFIVELLAGYPTLIPVGIAWYVYFLRPVKITVARNSVLEFSARRPVSRGAILENAVFVSCGEEETSFAVDRLRVGPSLDGILGLAEFPSLEGDFCLCEKGLYAARSDQGVHYSPLDAKMLWRRLPFFWPISVILAPAAAAIPGCALAVLTAYISPSREGGEVGGVITLFSYAIGFSMILGVALLGILALRCRHFRRSVETISN